jgi:hypothetical protein
MQVRPFDNMEATGAEAHYRAAEQDYPVLSMSLLPKWCARAAERLLIRG